MDKQQLRNYILQCLNEDTDDLSDFIESPEVSDIIVSDMLCKNVIRKVAYGDALSDSECKRLIQMYNNDNKDRALNDSADADDSVLDSYADNIYNYIYNYKDEARDIDPSIDPNQEQIGPMAQDIEKVNPSCIAETPEGVKTVDTRKLSLMNTGAIADLAREIRTLKEALNG